jgi:uncharacterized protein (UPF0276 family)
MAVAMTSNMTIRPSTDLSVGVSLKAQHYQLILEQQPSVDFFEIHAENYMVDGGAHHRFLEAISNQYPISLHGVGMSLGSAEGLDDAHVARFRELVDRYNPALVSEHLAWSVEGETYLNDLLPFPLNAESLAVVVGNVNRVQDAIGRKLLVENPSSYMTFKNSDIPEVEFLADVVGQTGCGLLLDVNNIYVSGRNMGWSPEAYLDAVDGASIGEIHLAGHLLKDIDGTELRIDDHGSAVADDVWSLYRRLINRVGVKPTLVEWDNNIPDFSEFLNEAEKARSLQTAMTPNTEKVMA